MTGLSKILGGKIFSFPVFTGFYCVRGFYGRSKKRFLRQINFPVNLDKFIRTSFSQNTFDGCLIQDQKKWLLSLNWHIERAKHQAKIWCRYVFSNSAHDPLGQGWTLRVLYLVP